LTFSVFTSQAIISPSLCCISGSADGHTIAASPDGDEPEIDRKPPGRLGRRGWRGIAKLGKPGLVGPVRPKENAMLP
jgi:hypothetical protein